MMHLFRISLLVLLLPIACVAEDPSGQHQDRVPDGKADLVGFCLDDSGDHCGGSAASGSCFCDDLCSEYNDCCTDKMEVCDGTGGVDTPDANEPTPDEPVPTDPFDPASCLGPPMTFEQAVARFAPGASKTTIGDYVVVRRRRSCNPVTGCEPWQEPTTLFTSTMSKEARGHIELRTSGNTIRLKLHDSTWEDAGTLCSGVPSSTYECQGYGYVVGTHWGGSGGLYPTWGGIVTAETEGNGNLHLSGIMTDSCLRLSQTASNPNLEEEYVVLAEIGDGQVIPEPTCPGGQTEMSCGSQASAPTTCCQLGLTTCPQSGCDCWSACN